MLRPSSMTPQPPLPRLCPMRSGHVAPPASAERLADGVVQSVNVVLAAAGCVVLGILGGAHADPWRLAALTAYGGGLLAMVGASALYAWARGGRPTGCAAISTMRDFLDDRRDLHTVHCDRSAWTSAAVTDLGRRADWNTAKV